MSSSTLSLTIAILLVLLLAVVIAALKIVKQYEEEVLFRLGRVVGQRKPGLRLIIPFVDVMHRVSLRIVTMPIQSQGIITRDNVNAEGESLAAAAADRCRQEHHRRVPRTTDEDARRHAGRPAGWLTC